MKLEPVINRFVQEHLLHALHNAQLGHDFPIQN